MGSCVTKHPIYLSTMLGTKTLYYKSVNKYDGGVQIYTDCVFSDNVYTKNKIQGVIVFNDKQEIIVVEEGGGKLISNESDYTIYFPNWTIDRLKQINHTFAEKCISQNSSIKMFRDIGKMLVISSNLHINKTHPL